MSELLDVDAYAIPVLVSDDSFRFSAGSVGAATITSVQGLAAIGRRLVGRTRPLPVS